MLKEVDERVSLFKPAANFTLLENMEIRYNIQVIIYLLSIFNREKLIVYI